MQKIIILRGCAASGKSTWAKEFCDNKKNNAVRVNRDDIRKMLRVPYNPKTEEVVIEIQTKAVTESLKKGWCVVLDNTYLNIDDISNLTDSLKSIGYTLGKTFDIYVKDFLDVSLETCIARDADRVDSIGEEAVRSLYDKVISLKNYERIKGIKHSMYND